VPTYSHHNVGGGKRGSDQEETHSFHILRIDIHILRSTRSRANWYCHGFDSTLILARSACLPHFFADDQIPYILLRPGGCSSSELVISVLDPSLVLVLVRWAYNRDRYATTYRCLVVAQHLCSRLCDHRDIHITTGSKIVENTRSDRSGDQCNGFFSLYNVSPSEPKKAATRADSRRFKGTHREVLLESTFKYRHCCKTSTS